MALFKAFKRIILSNQVKPLQTLHSCVLPAPGGILTVFTFHPQLKTTQWRRFSHSATLLTVEEVHQTDPNVFSLTKTLKVAIVGRPNAGKSTLINSILNINICDVSRKTHTTRSPLQTAFTRGDTQIVFVDTPGLVTQKEFSKFELSKVFRDWEEKVLNEVDIIGIIHEVTSPKDITKLHLKLVQSIQDIPQSKPMFIILNKVDLVLDKDGLSKAIEKMSQPVGGDQVSSKVSNIWNKFSRVFVTSALKSIGVSEIVDFLLEQAKPGDWAFQPSVLCNKPLHVLVTNLLRAKIMEILPHEVPYKCLYQVEYLEENDLGEIICVALVKCEQHSHYKMLVGNKKSSLKRIAKELESDLFKITGKVFKLRVVVVNLAKPKQHHGND